MSVEHLADNWVEYLVVMTVAMMVVRKVMHLVDLLAVSLVVRMAEK